MIKKTIFILFFLVSSPLYAANLLQVYRDALQNDPVYQEALAQELSDAEGVPISLSNLLPNAGVTVTPALSKTLASGSALAVSNDQLVSGNNSQRSYDIDLTITQTLFDLGKFANLSLAKETAKQARAILSAASQDLMIRVSRAYLAVLEDEDNVRSVLSTKTAFNKQLYEVTEQYKVGLKTITDVYTTRASYQNSVADYISAENQLANDRENLRTITGTLYPSLSTLSTKFPMITPNPADIEVWVKKTEAQNWFIRAAEYAKSAALSNIKQQRAGHYPTLNLTGDYDVTYNRDTGSVAAARGSSQLHTRSVSLTLDLPIYEGGGVLAQTRRAKYDYLVTSQRLEKQIRNQTNLARQSYLGIIAGISKIKADQQTITSTISSLEGMEAAYSVGTETLLNVLTQRQRVVQAQKQYASDRYAYVNNLLTLKQAAGTLSEEDLVKLNAWMINP